MEYILASLDMFASIAENLINYSFNASFLSISILTAANLLLFQLASNEMNEIM